MRERGPITTITIIWRFPRGVWKEEIQPWTASASRLGVKETLNINVVGKKL